LGISENRGSVLGEKEGQVGDFTRARLQPPTSLIWSTIFPAPFPWLSTSPGYAQPFATGDDDSVRHRTALHWIAFHMCQVAPRVHSAPPPPVDGCENSAGVTHNIFHTCGKPLSPFKIKQLDRHNSSEQRRSRSRGELANPTRNCSISGRGPQLVFVSRREKCGLAIDNSRRGA
jgi:hypothetical protein